MKETFIIRTEWMVPISELSSDDKATIFMNLFHYHNLADNLINLNNLPVKLVWGFIEPTLKRNNEAWDKRKETSVENGKKGGRPKIEEKEVENNLNNLNKPTEKPNQIKEPIESLSVSVYVSDSVSVSDINKKEEDLFAAVAAPVEEILNKENLPQLEKKEKEKISAEKEKEISLFPQIIDAYNDFIIERTGIQAPIGALEGKAAKEIIKSLSKACEQKGSDVIEAWMAILMNWEKLDKFYQSQIKLNQISANITNILNQIRNGSKNSNSGPRKDLQSTIKVDNTHGFGNL